MAIDSIDSRLIRHANMIWLNADKFSPFLVRCINALVSLSLPSLEQEPEIRELGSEWPWDISYGGIRYNIRDKEEEDDGDRNGPGSEEKICDGHRRLQDQDCCRGLIGYTEYWNEMFNNTFV